MPGRLGIRQTLYHRWFRWSRMGVFARRLMDLAAQDRQTGAVMVDAIHLQAYRTAASLHTQKGDPATGAGA